MEATLVTDANNDGKLGRTMLLAAVTITELRKYP